MRILVLISLLSLIGVIKCLPQQILGQDIPVQAQIRTEQKKDEVKETVAVVSKQLMQDNLTDWDTRTPPKIKVHRTTKRPALAEIEEVSHMGVAEPVDVEKFMETTTKDVPKTTTDSGLSTWILLSGNSPTKPPRKVPTKPSPQPSTVKFVEKTTKFPQKPKTTTTRKPPTSTKKVPTTKLEVSSTEPTKLMTKIKASVLQNKTKATKTTPSSSTSSSTTASSTVSSTTPKTTTTTEVDVNDLGPEAKIVDLELLESRETTKKPTKRPATAAANNANNANNKKKKNKVRRRKPEDTKTKTNATKLATKEKPIATQFYNYLSREVMPTVGVGLVGLVLTAGLASYFLFPFQTLRRNYVGALDRRDDHAYDTYFSDGELEQDVIGKMIEGGYEYNSMSNSVYQPSGYQPSNRYDYKYDDRIVAERHKESGYTVDDRRYENKFQNIPENFVPVTPAVVPEHGPRKFPENLKTETSTTETTTRKFVVGNIPEGYIPGAPIGVPEHGPRSLRIRRSFTSSQKSSKKLYPKKTFKSIPEASIDEVSKNFRKSRSIKPIPIEELSKKGKQKRFHLRKKTAKSIPVASIDEVSNENFSKRSKRSLPSRNVPKSVQTDSKSLENEVTGFKNDMGVSKEVPKRKIRSTKQSRNVPKELENVVLHYKGDIGVPKHGPRSLRLRRDTPVASSVSPKDLQDNEITTSKEKFHKHKLTKYAEMKKNATLTTTEATPAPTEKNETTSTTIYYEEQPTNIFSFLRNIFEMKVRIGLNFLLNTTENFSKYLRGVQERVEKVIVENRERYKKQH